MRARALIVCGSALLALGLFVLSPAVWLMVDQLFQQMFGAPLVGIIVGGGGIMAPLILTALGTAGIVGGWWMTAAGNRRRRAHSRPPVSVPKPPDTATIGE
jgi:hypothetical protein